MGRGSTEVQFVKDWVPNRENLDALAALLESGDVKVVIDKIYPLRESANAVAHMLGHPCQGEDRHHCVATDGGAQPTERAACRRPNVKLQHLAVLRLTGLRVPQVRRPGSLTLSEFEGASKWRMAPVSSRKRNAMTVSSGRAALRSRAATEELMEGRHVSLDEGVAYALVRAA
jgi:hypothetical protein